MPIKLDVDLDQIDRPFAITPSPRYFYLAPQYKAALQDTIRTLVRREGLCIIEGPIGGGKSTMLRYLIDWIGANVGEKVALAYLSNPSFSSALQFLKAICEAFKVPLRSNKLDQIDELKRFLSVEEQEGRIPVLLVDEAHRLNGEQFELIRELFNFTHNDKFMISIALAGEDKPLRQRLKHKPAVKSRARYHIALRPLDLDETAELIRFRLHVTSLSEDLFDAKAVERIWKASGGIPRSIVKVCGLVFDHFEETPARIGVEHVDEILALYPEAGNA